MIIEIIIIICIGIVLVILLKRLPQIANFNFKKIKSEASIFSEKQKIDAANAPMPAKEQSKIPLFSIKGQDEHLFEEADRLFLDKKYKEAEKIFLKLISKNPQNIKIYNRLGVIYMESGNYKDAKDAFLEAVRLDPDKASRHYNLAMVSIELKEYRNAAESLERAIKLDNKNNKYKDVLVDLKKKIKYRYKEMKRTED